MACVITPITMRYLELLSETLADNAFHQDLDITFERYPVVSFDPNQFFSTQKCQLDMSCDLIRKAAEGGHAEAVELCKKTNNEEELALEIKWEERYLAFLSKFR